MTKSTLRFALFGILLAVFLTTPLVAYDGHTATFGPLTLSISEIPVVERLNEPFEAPVTLTNTSDVALDLIVTASVIDDCRIVGQSEQRVEVPAEGEATLTFQVVAGEGTLSAHYPVWIGVRLAESETESPTLRAVQVFETDIQQATTSDDEPTEQPITIIPIGGAVMLNSLNSHRPWWGYYDEPLNPLPIGWTGSHEESRTTLIRSSSISRGESRRALTVHPPYTPKGGTSLIDYRLQLPEQGPLTFEFYNAIRDHHENEPASDGVTFRVWVREDGANVEDRTLLFEEHTDSKVWQPCEVDLTPYAGKCVLLSLESHPGPARNTVCDSCYWGDPIVFQGKKPPSYIRNDRLRSFTFEAWSMVSTGTMNRYVDQSFLLPLASGTRAGVIFGPNGLTDGVIALARPQKHGPHPANIPTAVCFSGIEIEIEGVKIGTWPSPFRTLDVNVEQEEEGVYRLTQTILDGEETFPLIVEFWAEGPALRIKVECERRITDLAFGPTNQHAKNVYFGHGYRVHEPEAFQINGGGHSLSTSHVAFDFEGGLSVLMATDVPPDRIAVDPEQKIYTLHTHPGTTFTLLPSTEGAFDAAIRYRPLYGHEPSAGVEKKAGRLVYDVWGSGFEAENLLLDAAFRYGATDALVMKHVWQRWGYDNRLPDIFPPDPKLGGLEPLQEMSRICREAGVPFGLHDNYIDFYPDAEDFTYDCITFNEDGRPRKAWINPRYEAQSYQWRPDKFAPFLDRNLELMIPAFQPTASFVDVFTSANIYDYYDRDGVFHSRTETRECWGECFNTLRDAMGGTAPTVSEAGNDFLIGYLDGADCQFMRLGSERKQFVMHLPCESWSRVPWFDAVNHTRFSLHGVGYSGRYQSGRSRALHGIESDDYISAELLTGHALMVDRASMFRGAVRKDWLAQHIIRGIADAEIEHVSYEEDEPRRIRVEWSDETVVHVNRSDSDWEVDGRILPMFGYYAEGPNGNSAIERIDGQVVEHSERTALAHQVADDEETPVKSIYVNSRSFMPDALLPIQPSADRLEYLGGNEFRLHVDWDAKSGAPEDLSVFMHFFKPQVSRLVLEGWYGGGGMPQTQTSQWEGVVKTGDNWTMRVPDDVKAGEYDVLVGLFDSGRGSGGRRYPLLGEDVGDTRYKIGTLIIERESGEVSDIRLVKNDWSTPLLDRLTPNATPVDFGMITTSGACRCDVYEDRIEITPLPLEGPMTVGLHLDELTPEGKESIASFEAIDLDGIPLGDVAHRLLEGDVLQFATAGTEFKLILRWE